MATQQSCSNYQIPTNSVDGDTMSSMINGFLGNMGFNQPGCSTSEAQAAMAGQVNAGIASATVSASASYANTQNCSMIQGVLENYLNTVYQAKCVLTNNITTTTIVLSLNTSLSVIASGPNSEITYANCPNGTNLTQNMRLHVIDFDNLSSQTVTNIASLVKSGLDATLQQLQTQLSAAGSTAESAHLMSAMSQKLSNSDTIQTISNAIDRSAKLLKINESANYIASGLNSKIQIPCNITQDSILSLQCAVLVSDAYTATISSELSAFFSSLNTQSQKSTATGPPSALDFLQNNWEYMVVGIVMLIVVGGVLYYFFKTNKGIGKEAVAKYNPEV